MRELLDELIASKRERRPLPALLSALRMLQSSGFVALAHEPTALPRRFAVPVSEQPDGETL